MVLIWTDSSGNIMGVPIQGFAWKHETQTFRAYNADGEKQDIGQNGKIVVYSEGCRLFFHGYPTEPQS